MDKNGNKTGGRKAGTPNKTTRKTKEAIADLLSSYVNGYDTEIEKVTPDGGRTMETVNVSIEADFAKVKPVERLLMAEKMMQYVMPKMQSVAVDAEISARQMKNAERLAKLSVIPEEKK